MRQAHQLNEIIKPAGTRLANHVTRHKGSHFRQSQRRAIICRLARGYSQRFSRLEERHHLGIRNRNLCNINTCHIPQHFQHRGIIVSQNVQFQDGFMHGIEIKVSCNRSVDPFVSRMLNRRKIVYFTFLGNDDDSAWMLAGCPLNTD